MTVIFLPIPSHRNTFRHIEPKWTCSGARFTLVANRTVNAFAVHWTGRVKITTVPNRTEPNRTGNGQNHAFSVKLCPRDGRTDPPVCLDTVDKLQRRRHGVTAGIAVDVVAVRICPSVRPSLRWSKSVVSAPNQLLRSNDWFRVYLWRVYDLS